MKIDAKRVLDSGVLCTVVDLHKREELWVRAVTETCSSRLQAMDEEMTNCYLKFFDMINKICKIIITALQEWESYAENSYGEWVEGTRKKGREGWCWNVRVF